MRSTSLHTRVVASLVLLLALAGCGGDSDPAASATDGSDIELGSGSVPETVPDDFPLPDSAVVGSTLVNHPTGETEMIVRLPTDVAVSVQYYEQNLDARGYSIDSSDAQPDGAWLMAFSRDDLEGSIEFRPELEEVSALVVRIEQ